LLYLALWILVPIIILGLFVPAVVMWWRGR
jgi:hypothetical protein